MSSDMGDDFREHREYMRGVKDARVDETLEILSHSGLHFSDNDAGRHLIFRYGKHTIDFWPTTGRWFDRHTGLRGRWIDKLLPYLFGVTLANAKNTTTENP